MNHTANQPFSKSLTQAPKHLVIVGCGFTGTSALFQLVHNYPVERITVFEKAETFGPGYAYQPDECPHYLMNNTNDSLCLLPQNRLAFHVWLQQKYGDGHKSIDTTASGHVPRSVFGEFLQEVIQTVKITAAVKGVALSFINEEVECIQEPNGVLVQSKNHRITGDAVVLCTGRSPTIDNFPHPSSASSSVYFSDHIRNSALDNLPSDAHVHVLGCSLSAYDVVNRLFAESTGCSFSIKGEHYEFNAGNNQRHVTLCSRSGRLKHAQSTKQIKVKSDVATRKTSQKPRHRIYFTIENWRRLARPLSLHQIADTLIQELEANGEFVDKEKLATPYANCDTLISMNQRAMQLLTQSISAALTDASSNLIVDLLDDAQLDLWNLFAEQLLSIEAEQQYRSIVESAILNYLAPAPVSTLQKLLALQKAGRLHIVSGVSEVSFDPAEDQYCISHVHGTETAKVLVNTTGATARYITQKEQAPLIKQLHDAALLHGYQREGQRLQGASVDMQTFKANGSQHIYLANALLWGPGFFTSSAFTMATIVDKLLKNLFSR